MVSDRAIQQIEAERDSLERLADREDRIGDYAAELLAVADD